MIKRIVAISKSARAWAAAWMFLSSLAMAPEAHAQFRFVYLDEPLRGGKSAPVKISWRNDNGLFSGIITYPTDQVMAHFSRRFPPSFTYQIAGHRGGLFRITSREFETPTSIVSSLFLLPGEGREHFVYLSWEAFFRVLLESGMDQRMREALYTCRNQIMIPKLVGLSDTRMFDPSNFMSLGYFLNLLNPPVDVRQMMMAGSPVQIGILLHGGGFLFCQRTYLAEANIITRLILGYLGANDVAESVVAIGSQYPRVWDLLPPLFLRTQRAPSGPRTERAVLGTPAAEGPPPYPDAYYEAKEADAADRDRPGRDPQAFGRGNAKKPPR